MSPSIRIETNARVAPGPEIWAEIAFRKGFALNDVVREVVRATGGSCSLHGGKTADCTAARPDDRLQSEPFPLAEQRARVDPEDLCRLFQARRPSEDSSDVLGFKTIERDAVADLDRGGAHFRRLRQGNSIGEVRGPDLGSGGEDRRAFHGVAKLPDIAGPGVTREGLSGFRREAGEAAAGLVGEEFEEAIGEGADVGPAPERGGGSTPRR